MKNVGKKLCVFLLVAVMVVSLLPAAAFAAAGTSGPYFDSGAYTKEDVDKFFNQEAREKVNGAIEAYAIIGEIKSDGEKKSSSTITIKSAEHTAQDACIAIVGGLLESLYNEVKGDQKHVIGKVKPVPLNPDTCLDTCPGPTTCLDTDGTMTFDPAPGENASLSGDAAKDKGTISDFCEWLGIMRVTENKLSELDGMSFAFTLVPSTVPTVKDSPTITYTFTFELPKLEVKPDEKGKLEMDAVNQTLTGDDLVDTANASGKTVTQVTDMFKEVARDLNAGIKVYNVAGKQVVGSSKVGTGYKVVLEASDGSELDHLTVVVKGDVDGNAAINITDALAILDNIAKELTLDGVNEQAAQLYDGKSITIKDALKVLDTIAAAQNNA